MSSKKKKNINDTSLLGLSEEKSKTITYTLLTEKLKGIYSKDYLHPFIKCINKLGMQFQMQSNKFQEQRLELERISNSIYKILIKEIEACIEEIERLNDKLLEKDNMMKAIKENEKETETERHKIKALEKEINERIAIEKTLNEEVKSYKRQISFYKDKLKLKLKNDKSKEKQCLKEEFNNAKGKQLNEIKPIVLKVNRMQNSTGITSINANTNHMNNSLNKSNIENAYSINITKEGATSTDNSFLGKKLYDTDRQRSPNKDIEMNKHKAKKQNRRSVSDKTTSNYVKYNHDKAILSDKSRNVLNPNFNKILTKMSLLNCSKSINPLFQDLDSNYNKEMSLLEYEETILQKVLNDLYRMEGD